MTFSFLYLSNPEDFEYIEAAQISISDQHGTGHLIIQNKHLHTHDYFVYSELGGKIMFGRNYGKGAKWTTEISSQ